MCLSPITEIAEALIGVALEPGDYTIELSFTPRGFKPGIMITFTSVVILFIIYCFYRKEAGKGFLPFKKAKESTETDVVPESEITSMTGTASDKASETVSNSTVEAEVTGENSLDNSAENTFKAATDSDNSVTGINAVANDSSVTDNKAVTDDSSAAGNAVSPDDTASDITDKKI